MPIRPERTLSAIRSLRKQLREVPASVPLIDVLDVRTRLGKRFRAMHEEYIAALGGTDHVSPQRRALVEQACRVQVIVDALDSALFAAGFDPRDEATRKLLGDANKARYLLSQLLAQAGLDRVARPPTVWDWKRPEPADPVIDADPAK